MGERQQGLEGSGGPRAFDLARHAFAGAGALSFAQLVAHITTLHLGDVGGVRVAIALALALGFAYGAITPDGPRAWLRSALVGALALMSSALLPAVTALATGARLPTAFWSREIVVAAVMLGVGFAVGLCFSMTHTSARARAAWFTGGAFGVVATAVIATREVGLQGALLGAAFFSLVASVRARRHATPARPARPAPKAARLELGAAFALGVFLEAARPIARDVMGPASENGVAVTAGVALALAAAALAGARLPIARARLLFVAALMSALATLLAPDLFSVAVHSWQVAFAPARRGAIKLAFLVVLVGPTVFALGAAALGRGRSTRVVAHLALGVVAGLMFTRFGLQPRVPGIIVLGAVAVFAASAGVIATERFQRRDAVALVTLSALLVVAVVRFPEAALSAGFLDAGVVPSSDSIVVRIDRLKQRGEELDVLRDSHGTLRVRGDGHDDAVVIAGRTEPHELLTGLIPASYTRSHERAFVFGSVGGVAAGAASRVFAQTTVVDASPVARAVYSRFQRYNFDVARRSGVSIEEGADPFAALAAAPGPFDAIISAAPALRDLAASKVTTLEFLHLARSRLAPGGVVALAVDDGVPVSGLAVLLRTLSDSFEECHFVFLERERYQVVCGEALAPRAPDLPRDVLATLEPWTAEIGVDRFFDALLLVPQQFHGDWFPVPNTFDLPVLDHVMAREDTRNVSWDLDLALHFDLSRTAMAARDFAGPAVFERCFALSVVGGGETLPRCTSILRGAAGRPLGVATAAPTGFPLPESVLELSAGAWSRDVPSVVSGAALLAELLYAGHDARARELVAVRSRTGTLTAAEATYARRRHLID